MGTLSSVRETAAENEQEVTTYVDRVTPSGHFAATSENFEDKCKTIYLLEGEKDDPNARVKGWIFMLLDGSADIDAYAFVTDEKTLEKSLGRVRSYFGPSESFESVFAQMAA